ncbi:MAG TPA: carbohydrate kinase [Clostridiales bacterium]|jgi:sugar (pentulose or hexulose) kinase|nr:carbohydrate kinase [Clostridiales bacterium]
MPDREHKYFLVLDAGTTKIKAAIISAEGSIIQMCEGPAEVLMPFAGACEMDMDALWVSVKSVLTELREACPDEWKQVSAAGISAQGDGLWMMDAEGKPIRNAILWNDTRTVMDFESINPICLGLNTCALFPGANGAILTWIKQKEPENYARIAHIFHCKDWINYKLTGHIGTDATDGSTALMNIYTKTYAYDLLDKLGIPEVKGALAPIYLSEDIIGSVQKIPAEELGLREGIPVIAGCLDVMAIATGCGLTSAGQRGTIVGTTLANYVVMDEKTARGCVATSGSILCHTKKDTYIRLMAALSGSSSLDWMRKELLGSEGYDVTDCEILKIPIGSGGVMSTPYLYGERAPFKLNSASGGYYGIRTHHTKYHLARASFEGMVLSMYDCYEHLPSGDAELYVAGGAAKSRCICQMICDCMGTETYRFEQKELGLIGTGRLLQSAFGIKSDLAAVTDRFDPDPVAHEQYVALYEDYKLLKESLMPFWQARLGREPQQAEE